MRQVRAIGFDYVGVVARFTNTGLIGIPGEPLVDDEILALVDQLRATGYKLGLLTNLEVSSWSESIRARGVDAHFDACLISGETGFAKPDHRAFTLLAERLGVPLDELLFIDDRPQSLTGIEQLGVTPVVYTGLAQLRADLVSHGITL